MSSEYVRYAVGVKTVEEHGVMVITTTIASKATKETYKQAATAMLISGQREDNHFI